MDHINKQNTITFLIMNNKYELLKDILCNNTPDDTFFEHLKDLNNYDFHKFVHDNLYLAMYDTDKIVDIIKGFDYTAFNETTLKTFMLYKPYHKFLLNIFTKYQQYYNIICDKKDSIIVENYVCCSTNSDKSIHLTTQSTATIDNVAMVRENDKNPVKLPVNSMHIISQESPNTNVDLINNNNTIFYKNLEDYLEKSSNIPNCSKELPKNLKSTNVMQTTAVKTNNIKLKKTIHDILNYICTYKFVDVHYSIKLLNNIEQKNKFNTETNDHVQQLLWHFVKTHNVELFVDTIENVCSITDDTFGRITDMKHASIPWVKFLYSNGYTNNDDPLKHLSKFDFCSVDIDFSYTRDTYIKISKLLKKICKGEDTPANKYYQRVSDDIFFITTKPLKGYSL